MCILCSEYFEVNAGSGVLYMTREIDRDEVCYADSTSVCRLTIDVALVRPVALFRAFQVHVDLLDLNDNDPKFDVEDFVLTIPESVSPGMLLRYQYLYEYDTCVIIVTRVLEQHGYREKDKRGGKYSNYENTSKVLQRRRENVLRARGIAFKSVNMLNYIFIRR